MRKGKYQKRFILSKTLALMLACVLLICGVVGGTVAWLTAQDTPVVNTFSTSNIGVELKETTTEYKMIPGWTISKDPKAWVTEGSEAAYLFVKVEKSVNFDTFMTYEIADGWTELTSAAGTNYKVYYREVATTQMGESNAFPILKDDKVTVLDTVKAEDMPAAGSEPTLTFTAYAHQLYKNENSEKFDVATAWGNLNPNK